MTTARVRIGTPRLGAAATGPASSAPARFEAAALLQTSVKEASDVVALPGGRFGVVSDIKDALYVIEADGRRRKVDLPGIKGLSELEGVAYDPVRQHLFVSREESREILRYAWSGNDDRPKLQKTIHVDIRGPENKGIEGLAWLPEQASPTGQAQLLAAKEGKPRQLLLYADSGKGNPLKVELEEPVKAALSDISAVTVDPKTGHVFLGSDESSTVAQVRLLRDGNKVRARLVQAIPLRDGRDRPLARIEGLAFNARGDLFVLTENDGALHQLKRL